MDQATDNAAKRYWQGQISRLRYQYNFGFFIQFFNQYFLIAALVMCPLLLLGRGYQFAYILPTVLIVFCAVLLLAFWVSRRHFFSTPLACAELEYHLGFNNALTAASLARADWPEPQKFQPIMQWRWANVLSLPVAAFALMALAYYIPLSQTIDVETPTAKPPNMVQLENWLQTLEQEQVVQEQAVKEFAEKVGQLTQQEAQTWYQHGTLEATDTLKQQTQSALDNLHQSIDMASSQLALQKSGQKPESELGLKQAIEQMAGGQFPLNQPLMDQLKEVQQQLQSNGMASQQQLQQMLDELEQAKQSLPAPSSSQQNMSSRTETSPGGSEVQRGPGTEPIQLNGRESYGESAQLETVSNDDLSQAALGQLVGLSKDEHEQEIQERLQAGGTISEVGQGGESVWVDTFTPQEQAIIESYFQ